MFPGVGMIFFFPMTVGLNKSSCHFMHQDTRASDLFFLFTDFYSLRTWLQTSDFQTFFIYLYRGAAITLAVVCETDTIA